MFSQSREGPGFSTLEAMISTVAPDFRAESNGTRRPSMRAPMQAWPTSVWIA